MMKLAAILSIGVSLALVNMAALADVRLVYQQIRPGKAPATETVEVSAPHLRADHAGGYMLFDAERQVMTMVNTGDKSYTEMTQADLQRSAGQLGEAMQKAQAMMKNLSPEQRQMMQNMMGGKMPMQAATAKFDYRLNAGSGEVAGHACRKVQVLRDGKPWMNLCVAPASELGISESDYAVFRTMSHLFQDSIGKMPQMGMRMPDLTQLGGVPLEIQDLTHGWTRKLVSSSSASIDKARFKLPAGYTRKAMPALP